MGEEKKSKRKSVPKGKKRLKGIGSMKTDIYFGDLKKHKINWRETLKDEPDDDYENDIEHPTPQDVLDILGFDPDKEDWSEEEVEKKHGRRKKNENKTKEEGRAGSGEDTRK